MTQRIDIREYDARLAKAPGKAKRIKATGTNKLHAKRITIDGITFASGAEGNRYRELKLLSDAKKIFRLECHPVFPLTINHCTIGRYTADFRYILNGDTVIEDVKGHMTERASLCIRVAQAVHGIEIKLLTKETDGRLFR